MPGRGTAWDVLRPAAIARSVSLTWRWTSFGTSVEYAASRTTRSRTPPTNGLGIHFPAITARATAVRGVRP